MPAQKTYWHLLDNKRLPTKYEFVSTRLHYYTTRGFEVDVPLQQWYRQYQQGSPLICTDWEQFVDPRQTTYTTYTGLQAVKETFVDGLLEWLEVTAYDQGLSSTWVQLLERVLAPCATLATPCRWWRPISARWGPAGASPWLACFRRLMRPTHPTPGLPHAPAPAQPGRSAQIVRPCGNTSRSGSPSEKSWKNSSSRTTGVRPSRP